MFRMLVAVVVLGLVMAACTAKQRAAISEATVRNVVAVSAAKEFKDDGFPIRDQLMCTAKASSSDQTHVGVLCNGTTTTGQPVTLAGTTNNDQGKGNFVGTVNGKQVFQKTCLGC
jgi:glucose/arabinose dehydrogenase